tara:strand:- start:633 stop:956 length:324 start_codon:yes stop_codon:yes gene_type:complete
MPMDYELADYAFAETDAPAMADALMAKVTTVTVSTPQDYSGVKVKTKTVDEIPIPPEEQIMGGPAPMMMAVVPPGLGQSQPPLAQPGAGSMGMQAAQEAMQMGMGGL